MKATKAAVHQEGLAVIDVPQDNSEVFYNPAQVLNRDMSIIAIAAFHRISKQLMEKKVLESIEKAKAAGRSPPNPLIFNGLNVLEPLAASGLRSFRYLKELPEIVNHVVVNDLDEAAAQNIETNRRLNDISEDKVTVFCKDASALMYGTLLYNQLSPKLQRLSNIPCGYTINDRVYSSVTERDAGSKVELNSATSAGESAKVSQLPVPLPISGVSPVEVDNMIFDVIDVDPYGSVAQFLDSAIQAVRPGGLLCLTSTDMPVLCGNTPGVAFYKYGGFPSKARYMHELSLRLLMNAVATAAAKYKRVATPLACCSVDFYVRLFVRITVDAEACKTLCEKTSITYQCRSCDSFRVLPLGERVKAKHPSQVKYRGAMIPEDIVSKCDECGGNYCIVGPFYSGPLYQMEFLKQCIEVCDVAEEELPGLTLVAKIKGMFAAMSEELLDVPLYYELPSLCHRLKLSMMKPETFKTALTNLNYRVSHFHREPQAIKTDAPNYVIFDILRKHAQTNPPKDIEKCPILSKEITVKEINFNRISNASNGNQRAAKWLPNPQPNWGPMSKAKRKREGDSDNVKVPLLTKSRINSKVSSVNPLIE